MSLFRIESGLGIKGVVLLLTMCGNFSLWLCCLTAKRFLMWSLQLSKNKINDISGESRYESIKIYYPKIKKSVTLDSCSRKVVIVIALIYSTLAEEEVILMAHALSYPNLPKKKTFFSKIIWKFQSKMKI